ncbi:MAG: YdcF family protein [Pseudomonadales bacterium]|nr:YdcF family protein [Pseudomonadales bacterium]
MLIRTIFTSLILPPAIQILLALVGIMLWRFKKGMALLCFGVSLSSLLLLSLPIVKEQIYQTLEIYPPVDAEGWGPLVNQPKTVVVILGGGRSIAPEYGGETLSASGLLRVRYGTIVANKVNLPILVTGGSVYEEAISEAELMAQALAELGRENVMLERLSKTTWENAKFTADILKREGIDTVILVTQAWHMRRSVYCFEEFGFKVVPAPTMFRSNLTAGLEYIPRADALDHSAVAIREWLALLLYSIFYEPPATVEAGDTGPVSVSADQSIET